jgi:type IV pilus biogenesis protein CpaD/CtpE
MKNVPMLAVATVVAIATLSGCASRKDPYAQPRLGVVDSVRPQDPAQAIRASMSAARFSVLADVAKSSGSIVPIQVGVATNSGEIVDNAKQAAADSCMQYVAVQFEDRQGPVTITARCDQVLAAGQKVSVTRNPGPLRNPRDLLLISVVQ